MSGVGFRRRVAAVAATAALLAAFTIGAVSTAKASNQRLSAPYAYTVGDDIADRMTAIFRTTTGLEAATVVTYDRKSRNLVAEILGSTEEVDGAEREIEGFVQAIRDGVAPYAKKQHGIVLTDADVTLIYYNDTGDEPPYEIVRRENGVFVEPAPPSGD